MESKNETLQPRLTTDVLTLSQVAKILQLSTQTVRRRFEDGTIPGKKIGIKWRCTRKSLDAYLETPNNSRAPSNDR
jgi:excisionase family DNA binding protein